MSKITRRNLLKGATVGGVAAGLGVMIKPESAIPAAGAMAQGQSESHGPHRPIGGPLASATVSFGQWSTSPSFDRHPTNSPIDRNVHVLIPYEVTIQAGGSVNFIISGAHQIGIYDNGTQFSDINGSLLETVGPLGPGLINDPTRRIYRGLNPFSLNYDNALGVRDRVEVVQFQNPGRYLVICLLVPHFADRMHGFVTVIP